MDKEQLTKGTVYLVGAGPGDPGLLTLRTRSLIENCDVLIFDNLANRRLHDWAPLECERIDVGKSPGRHTMEQSEIGKLLVSKAKEGLRVVRLKGGDPFVFGRCAEEMLALDEARISYEVVPGVTAALACAAYAGIPLSHRNFGSSISFLTGHEDVAKESLRVDFAKFSEVGGTLCIYMGMSKLDEIVDKLIAGGLSPNRPAAIVSHGTLPGQRKILAPLGQLVDRANDEQLCAPAIIFVGNSIGLARSSTWFEEKPLLGRRFALTRADGQQSKMRSALENLGAETAVYPGTIVTVLGSETLCLETRKKLLPTKIDAFGKLRYLFHLGSSAVSALHLRGSQSAQDESHHSFIGSTLAPPRWFHSFRPLASLEQGQLSLARE